jgi:dolichol-phosphate mannosyltransferase
LICKDEKANIGAHGLLKSGSADLVVGSSRYVAGGGIGGLEAARANMSAFATRLSRIICKAEIADPMSGFFMLRRDVLEGGSPAPFWSGLQDSPRHPGVVAAVPAD